METATDVFGTCLCMCPDRELVMREREGLLHPFEVQEEDMTMNNKASRRPKADWRKVVKQFSRPAAGRADTDPSQLRPAPVLSETVSYLFGSIVPKDHPAWSNVYEFVFDRLRAVRQDMVMQGIVGREAINILEQVVRFHLYASYRLKAADAADFDPVINKQHLLECLKRLLYLYKVCPGHHRHREEFEAIYLLDNLGDGHALQHCLELSPELRASPLVRQCYEISSEFVLRNYSRALRLISRLPSAMCLCAVNPHLNNLRVNYLQILSTGYSMRNCKYPVEKLRDQLALTSLTSVVDLCTKCCLVDRFDHPDPNREGNICFNKALFKRPQSEQRPLPLAPLDAVLGRESVPSLLTGQGKPSTAVTDRDMNQVLCGLSNVSVVEAAKPGDVWSVQSSVDENNWPAETSSSSRTGLGKKAERVTVSTSVRIEKACMPNVSGSSIPVSSDCEAKDLAKVSVLCVNSAADSNQLTPSRGRGGRGVRSRPQGESILSTPGRGRGRGRRKI